MRLGTRFDLTRKNASRALASVLVLATLMGCAPQITGGLPDEPGDEISDGAADRASDVRSTTVSQDRTLDAPLALQELSVSAKASILDKYSHLDPKHLVPSNLLATALTYFDEHASAIKNKNYLSVIDFALPSSKRRFFIINMSTGDVLATTVAHGKGSDANNDGYADRFSNTSGTNASSVGVYLTAETYSGSHGLSLRLDGKSATNSNVRARAIVVHGAAYVLDKEQRQGRSWGCPAVPMALRDRIIGMIKGGSVIYANVSNK